MAESNNADDPLARVIDIEAQGAANGLNPMFGRYEAKFPFPPVSYSAPLAARQAFVARVRAALGVSFLFTGFVKLAVQLFLDEQTLYESDRYGDIDNYAKSVNDALKGPEGILIDDSQIQDLSVWWTDTTTTVYFRVEILGVEDEFVARAGLRLFEMPDGLYYPGATRLWSDGTMVDVKPIDRATHLFELAQSTTVIREYRNQLRRAGLPQRFAYQDSRILGPSRLGFHRTRAVASGFPLVSQAQWREELDELKRDSNHTADLTAVEQVFHNLEEVQKPYTRPGQLIDEHVAVRRKAAQALRRRELS